MKASLLLLLLAVGISAQIKKPEPPAVKPLYENSLQAVVVTTDDWSATTGEAQVYERKDVKSKWKAVGKEFEIVVGRSGLGTTRDDAWQMDLTTLRGLLKKEGDGRSPAGLIPLTFAFGKQESITSALSYRKLEDQTECVDDVNSHHYNRVVGRLQVGIYDWKSSEKMASITPEYDLGVFVAYNSYPVIKGNGSCIFLHIWKDANTPTSGCTAMAREDLERVVGWLDPKKNPYLIQMPEKEYSQYRKAWNLPDHK
ncbi:MAG TPA: L,D-transpeptidase family protein [Pyrinomonadaceae bacterium]|jgi:D-alanyl-D-alanine dipeptidase|nr:L,D-transpeptidase family protein [Pyrinomonadaceae bacterium]